MLRPVTSKSRTAIYKSINYSEVILCVFKRVMQGIVPSQVGSHEAT